MNHKYEQRTICPNGEIRTRTIDANELVDLLLQMHCWKAMRTMKTAGRGTRSR